LKWIHLLPQSVAVTFDLYGTLVTADRPAEPWAAVAAELDARDVSVPADWESAYRSAYVEADPLAEVSLVDHTVAALASRGVNANPERVRESLLAAFDGPVTILDGADEALGAAAAVGPVGVLSNCSLPGLVDATLERADLRARFDAVVTSVGCGWRKPHDRAFEAGAASLGVTCEDLVHVGDDARTDGGGRTAGARVFLTSDVPLSELPSRLGAGR
jgi:FMN phosphatase YigB (HAD superfamily)